MGGRLWGSGPLRIAPPARLMLRDAALLACCVGVAVKEA